jgi:CxxC motif-containing protein (DUF1111 family)
MRHVHSSGLGPAVTLTIATVFGLGYGQPAIAASFGGGLAGGVASDDSKKQPTSGQVEDGKNLFLKRWKEADFMSASGDGLGPVYNARSCAECHGMSGPGGAGGNDHNVDLLTVTPPSIPKYERGGFAKRMEALDPVLTAGFKSVRPAVTLHRFGVDPEYGDWRLGLLKLVTHNHKATEPATGRSIKELLAQGKKKNPALSNDVRLSDLLHLGIVQRGTPALFGAGLIDQIPEEAIQEIAKSQARAQRHDGIKGQMALAIGGTAGKFGWRGQTASLKEFVMGACANELGLEVPGHAQGIDPLDPTYHVKGNDLTQEQCNALTAFVASLPRPAQRKPINLAERKLWDGGEQVFNSVGCANCHVRTVANVDGLYSDLLLHDLGPRLEDPAGANPSPSSGGASPAYYGGPTDVFAAVPPITRRQWRTPPLWGVADSAPYLHDGRAATLTEAIQAHGGEATASVRLFVMLPSGERQRLLAFLNSLSAPSEENLVAQK